MQRLPDAAEALGFMETQAALSGVYMVRLAFGVMVFLGLLTYFYSFFVKEEKALA